MKKLLPSNNIEMIKIMQIPYNSHLIGSFIHIPLKKMSSSMQLHQSLIVSFKGLTGPYSPMDKHLLGKLTPWKAKSHNNRTQMQESYLE